MSKWGWAAAALLAGVSSGTSAGVESVLSHGYNDATMVLAAAETELPLSKDELFGSPSGAPRRAPPASKQELFEVDDLDKKPPAAPNAPVSGAMPKAAPDAGPGLAWQGFFQTELAYAYENPEHWTKIMGRLELGTQGKLGSAARWKISARLDYNPVYDLTDHYSDSVRDDQLVGFQLRETYVDFSAGGLDWRLGRQNIVWGEMVGLFFADVVSARDMREFLLPDFQILRIPQWAARAEYFKNDFHAELVWIPFPSYDKIGKPFDPTKPGAGADFFPYPISAAGIPLVSGEDKPDYALNHTNTGLRLSHLSNGWDLSGFLYSSMDTQATFYRDPVNKRVFYPRHERIWQAGGTLAKDFTDVVLKAELVYTHGRQFNTVDLADEDGLVQENTYDWVVGLDFHPMDDTRINTQFFQRIYTGYDSNTLSDRVENGFSLLANYQFSPKWEAEVLLVRSLNRADWMLRPKVSWKFQPNWRLVGGVDVLHGPPTGFFGRYDQQDRVYTELRRDF
jgi:hypothetical protein